MNQIQAFNMLLVKYKFMDEVPDFIQEYVSDTQKKALISSLKKLGASGLFYSFILLIYFSIRKKGYSISLAASKAVAWVFIAIAGFSAAGGAVYIAANLNEEKAMTDQTIITDKISNEILQQSYQKYRLGIGQFMSRDNDSELSKKITNIIANELTALMGKDCVLELDKERKGKKVNLVLVGAVGKLGRELIISTKIIDVENSQVLFAENVKAVDDTDIEVKARNLSQSTAKYLKEKFRE
jgi:TolB-like protein